MLERIGNLSRRELLKLFGISVGTSLAGEAHGRGRFKHKVGK